MLPRKTGLEALLRDILVVNVCRKLSMDVFVLQKLWKAQHGSREATRVSR